VPGDSEEATAVFTPGQRLKRSAKKCRMIGRLLPSIWLNVENRNGYFQRVAAFEGESMVKALVRSNVHGIAGKFLGEVSFESLSNLSYLRA
jgi:hypothetical protein